MYFEGQGNRVSRLALRRFRRGEHPLPSIYAARRAICQARALDGG